MKKLYIFLLFAILFLSACSEQKESRGKKVLLLINGELGDKSFFDSAQRGMDMIKKEFSDTEVKTVEMGSDETKYDAILEDKVESKEYDLIVAGTWQMKDRLKAMSEKYPYQKFILFDDDAEGDKNIYSVMYKQNEGGFLAGSLAAMLAEKNSSDTIGFLGGMNNPIIKDFMDGYEDGAKYIDKNIKIVSSYVGNFTDAIRGRDLSDIMYKKEGACVVFNVASLAGLGSVDAAYENKKYVIGVDSDQAMLFGEPKAQYIAASILKNVDLSLLRAYKLYREGKLEFGKCERLGLNEDGIGISDNSYTDKILGEDIKEKINKIIEDIKTGKIKIRTEF